MINTIATIGLVALLAAFTVCAVLLNEGQQSARRRARTRDRTAALSAAEVQVDVLHVPEAAASGADDRRLAVGDFLFGALALRGYEPFATADLAAAAADSGLDISQVLAWLERAEQSGIVERLEGTEEDGLSGRPSVRLTAEGLDRARENRRSARRSAPIGP